MIFSSIFYLLLLILSVTEVSETWIISMIVYTRTKPYGQLKVTTKLCGSAVDVRSKRDGRGKVVFFLIEYLCVMCTLRKVVVVCESMCTYFRRE